MGSVYVQMFDVTLANFVGEPPGLCIHSETCGRGMALEHNGDLYSCDHFVEPDYRLGNINETHIIELASSVQQMMFGLDKRDALPQFCLDCDVRFACHGECPKNRFLTTPDGEPGLNYLCAGFKQFFHHVDRPVRLMVDLMRSGRPAADVMAILASEEEPFVEALRLAGRNDPCPCGSGVKVKRCHGRTVPATRLPDWRDAPRPPATERGRKAQERRESHRPG